MIGSIRLDPSKALASSIEDHSNSLYFCLTQCCQMEHLGEEKHTIIAVADITQELAEKFALQFNIPKYHDNFEALWQENDVGK